MDKIKICIVGNSVAIRIRPNENEARVYGTILQDLLNHSQKIEVSLVNLSTSRLLAKEVVESNFFYLDNDQDITIINLGCVDAPFRDIPLWFSDIIFKRKGKVLYSIFNPIYQYVIARFRPFLVKARGSKPWVPIKEFRNNIEEILNHLNGKSKTIVLGINAGNQRVENQLPNTMSRYRLYSEAIQDVCSRKGATFIDTLDLESEKYFPDGVHYNYAGHALIAKRIYDKLGCGIGG